MSSFFWSIERRAGLLESQGPKMSGLLSGFGSGHENWTIANNHSRRAMVTSVFGERSSKREQLPTGLMLPAESRLRNIHWQNSVERRRWAGSVFLSTNPKPGLDSAGCRLGQRTLGGQMGIGQLAVPALRFARMKTPTGWAGNRSNDFCLCREASKHRDQFVEPVFTAKPLVSRVIELVGGFRNSLAAGLAVAALVVGNGPSAADSGQYYVRTGLGIDDPRSARFADADDCHSARHYYGCDHGVPYHSIGEFGPLVVLELGVGYDANSPARFEFLVEYRPHVTFSGEANFLASGREQSANVTLSSASAMAAAFVDLDKGWFPIAGHYQPFIGVGFGAVRNKVSSKTTTFPATITTLPGASHVDKAWMVTAGYSIPHNDRVTFEAAWRYTDLGEVRTGTDEGQVVWKDGSRPPRPLTTLGQTWARLKGHGIRLSLRHSF